MNPYASPGFVGIPKGYHNFCGFPFPLNYEHLKHCSMFLLGTHSDPFMGMHHPQQPDELCSFPNSVGIKIEEKDGAAQFRVCEDTFVKQQKGRKVLRKKVDHKNDGPNRRKTAKKSKIRASYFDPNVAPLITSPQSFLIGCQGLPTGKTDSRKSIRETPDENQIQNKEGNTNPFIIFKHRKVCKKYKLYLNCDRIKDNGQDSLAEVNFSLPENNNSQDEQISAQQSRQQKEQIWPRAKVSKYGHEGDKEKMDGTVPNLSEDSSESSG